MLTPEKIHFKTKEKFFFMFFRASHLADSPSPTLKKTTPRLPKKTIFQNSNSFL